MEAIVEQSWKSTNEEELTLCTGDIITNVLKVDDDWFEGQIDSRKGRFKADYVKLMHKDISSNLDDTKFRDSLKKRKAKVLFSYSPANDDELRLEVNDIIEVIEDVEEGWCKGILKGNVGVFPSNFVEEIYNEVPEVSLRKEKVKEKIAEKEEMNDTSEGNIHSSPTHQEIKPKPVKGIGLGNIFQDGMIKLRSSEQSSEKKTPVLPKKPPPSSSCENAPKLPPKPIREQVRVLFNYEQQNEDELTIKEGDIIAIITKDIEDKGWWKGELNGRTGVFPNNFVETIKAEEVQAKKPERPEKPSVVLSNKTGKPDLSEKPSVTESPRMEKKNSKVPPNKPPPPDLPKKEDKPEKPNPPLPSKKPVVPPPLKKPTRTSIGAKLSQQWSSVTASSSTTSVNSTVISADSSTVSTTTTSISTNVALSSVTNAATAAVISASSSLTNLPTTNGLATSPELPSNNLSPKLQPEKNSNNIGETFDNLESAAEKLIHLTASRAKAPNRRPPSHIFIKENEKENGDICSNEQSVLKEKIQNKKSSPVSTEIKENAKQESTTEQEERIKVPPRPIPPLQKVLPDINKDEVRLRPKSTGAVPLPVLSPSTLPSSSISPPTNSPSVSTSNTAVDGTHTKATSHSSLEVEVKELRKQIQMLQETTVSKAKFEEIQKLVSSLEDTVEHQKNYYDKLITDLKNEIGEEKKLRIALQEEMDHIKQLSASV